MSKSLRHRIINQLSHLMNMSFDEVNKMYSTTQIQKLKRILEKGE